MRCTVHFQSALAVSLLLAVACGSEDGQVGAVPSDGAGTAGASGSGAGGTNPDGTGGSPVAAVPPVDCTGDLVTLAPDAAAFVTNGTDMVIVTLDVEPPVLYRVSFDGSETALGPITDPYLVGITSEAVLANAQSSATTLVRLPLNGDPPVAISPTTGTGPVPPADASTFYQSSGSALVALGATATQFVKVCDLRVGDLITGIVPIAPYVYFATQPESEADRGRIYRVKADGTEAATVLVDNLGRPEFFVGDASGLYWMNTPIDPMSPGTGLGLLHVTLDGGEWTILRPTAMPSGALALDASYLYVLGDELTVLNEDGTTVRTDDVAVSMPGTFGLVGGNAVWLQNGSRSLSSTVIPTLVTACP